MTHETTPLFVPHHYHLYDLRPGLVTNGGLTHHNSYGFRGPEFVCERTPGRPRIIAIGESTTYCTGIADDDATYPARLQVHLGAGGVEAEVLNGGVPGFTSAEVLIRYLFKVQPLQPDLVIYYFTHNDVHPRRFPTLSRDYREYSRVWLPRHLSAAARAKRLLRRLLGAEINRPLEIGDVVRRYDEMAPGGRPAANVERNGPTFFRENLRSLAMVATGYGARMLFVLPPYRGVNGASGDCTTDNPAWRGVHEHRQVAAAVAREFHQGVYDLAADMPYVQEGPPGEYYLDRTHVNERGADLMARLIAGAIAAQSLLEARP